MSSTPPTPTSNDVSGGKKVRKPYTITKSRESWSDEEHDKFIEALQLSVSLYLFVFIFNNYYSSCLSLFFFLSVLIGIGRRLKIL